MFESFDFDVIRRSLAYLFFDGMTFTLTLTGLGALGGLIFGTLIALMRLSGYRLLGRIAGLYVDLMRSLPLVLVIFWFYFLVPYIGQWVTGSSRPIRVGAFTSSLVTFILFEAAYFSEIMRAGIQSISKGQPAAASALGLTYAQSMRYVVLPQAFRIIMPPLTSEFLSTIKNTSVAITIGLIELTGEARAMQEFSFQVFEAFTGATVLYLLINIVVVIAMRFLERSIAIPGYITGK